MSGSAHKINLKNIPKPISSVIIKLIYLADIANQMDIITIGVIVTKLVKFFLKIYQKSKTILFDT
jgi:hypothetical protein